MEETDGLVLGMPILSTKGSWSGFWATGPTWIKWSELEDSQGLILCFRGKFSRASSRLVVAGRNKGMMTLEQLSSPPRSEN